MVTVPTVMKPNEKLRDLREARGLTRQKVARALSISERTVLRHELDQTPLSTMHLRAYADFYGVSVDELRGVAA